MGVYHIILLRVCLRIFIVRLKKRALRTRAPQYTTVCLGTGWKTLLKETKAGVKSGAPYCSYKTHSTHFSQRKEE
jgi:hypothetical protein